MRNVFKFGVLLAPGDFYPIAQALKLWLQDLPLVALDFDFVTFERAAHAAFLFQLAGERFQLRGSQRQAAYHRDSLAAAALGFAVQADDAVTHCCRTCAATDAGGFRALALRAEPAAISRVNQAGICAVAFGHEGPPSIERWRGVY